MKRYQPPMHYNSNYNSNYDNTNSNYAGKNSNYSSGIYSSPGQPGYLTRNQRKRIFKRQRLEDEEVASSTSTEQRPHYQHPEHLCLVLCDENTLNGKSVLDAWKDIEAKLSDMVVDHVLSSTVNEEKSIKLPSYEMGQLFRGYRQLKCKDEFSMEFLTKCVEKISDEIVDGMKLMAVPLNEIPPQPRALVWLPKVQPTWSKILAALRAQNPNIPMDHWTIQKIDELTNSLAIHLYINEESIEPIQKAGYQLYFGIRHAKVKIIPISQRGVHPKDVEKNEPVEEEQEEDNDQSD